MTDRNRPAGTAVPKDKCSGCGACSYVCPSGVAKMKPNGEGFEYPSLDSRKCTGCGQCRQVCPVQNHSGKGSPAAFAVRCAGKDTLQNSSSGGVFSLIADKIIDKGGLVCGAVFDDRLGVVHRLSRDIVPMRGSKYVQSSLNKVLPEIEKALSESRSVLFTGTPCQCHAIKLLFGDNPDLFLCSVICRGVSSPRLWRDWLEHLELKTGAVRICFFRDKTRADNGGHVRYETESGEYVVRRDLDPFLNLYMRGLSMRLSCYSCPYSGPENISDLTLGDFNSGFSDIPDDGRGMSLVLVQNRKGRKLLESTKEDTDVFEPIDMNSLNKPEMESPIALKPLRRIVFGLLEKGENLWEHPALFGYFKTRKSPSGNSE